MSTDIMNRIWWREDIDPTTKFVAIALGDNASDEGVCWPSVGTLMRKTGFSRRTIQTALSKLEGMVLLRKHLRHDSSSVYVFVLDNMPLVERERGDKEASLFESGALGTPPRAGNALPRAGDAPPPRRRCAPPAQEMRPEPSLEPSDEPSLFSSGVLEQNARPPLHEFVEERWHQLKREHTGVTDVRKIDDGMRYTIELRAKQHAKSGQDGYAVWEEFFETVERSAFLTGKLPPGQGRSKRFSLALPWALKADNFRKIIGGQYDGDSDPNTHDPATGRRFGPTEQALRGSLERLRHAQERRRGGGNQGSHLALPAQ